jgi:hypothetical protein
VEEEVVVVEEEEEVVVADERTDMAQTGRQTDRHTHTHSLAETLEVTVRPVPSLHIVWRPDSADAATRVRQPGPRERERERERQRGESGERETDREHAWSAPGLRKQKSSKHATACVLSNVQPKKKHH